MKRKIVPVEATPEMVLAVVNDDSQTRKGEYRAAIAAAPPYVVTDEDVAAASEAEKEAFYDAIHANAGGTWSQNAARLVSMRAALEAFLKRLGGES